MLASNFSLVVTAPVEGCNPPNSLHTNVPPGPNPANNYTRGCSKITRCQRDI
ncbi:unnamed protein product [Eruca vesicaria subsp. sativa]|uniref:Rapid ALkalinization Factor n=1 Tax=Eruca vesicaria subsp. sativa TaxID=29727 RepID=A0ABC8IZK0_ERUVS|nr:unnamed protein product [Eruca vesicaria subsp. sativa]